MMRVSIGTKIFGIAVGLLLLMTIVSLLGLRLSVQVTDRLKRVVDEYVPAYSALARANVRSAEQSAALRGFWTLLLETTALAALYSQITAGGRDSDEQLTLARRAIEVRLAARDEFDDVFALAKLSAQLEQLGELRAAYETYIHDMSSALEKGDRATFDRLRPGYFRLRDTLNQKLGAAREDIRQVMQQVADATIA